METPPFLRFWSRLPKLFINHYLSKDISFKYQANNMASYCFVFKD